MTTPTGRELDHAIALSMGWTVKGSNPPGTIYIDRDGHKAYAMSWHASLDALFGAGGPVEYVVSKGWRISIYTDEFSKRVLVWRGGYGEDSTRANVASTTTAAALATAIYEALKESPDD